MRVWFFSSGKFGSTALLRVLSQGHEIVGVSGGTTNTQWKNDVYVRILQTGLIKRECFFYSDPFRDIYTIDKICKTHKLSLSPLSKLSSDQHLSKIEKAAPDIGIVCGFPKIIPSSVFNLPRLGTINLHPSLLPRHRGGTPARWVIYNGETKTGVTAHRVAEKFDTGPILLRREIVVAPTDTGGDLELRLAHTAADIVEDILVLAENGNLAFQPQDENEARHEKPFHGALQNIDWSQSAGVIAATCRAIRPRSGGFAYIHGCKVCLWEVDICQAKGCAPPGTVLALESNQIDVMAGKGMVRIKKFLESARIVPASKLARHIPIQIGDRFSSCVR